MSAAKMLVPENQKQGAGPHTSRSETMAAKRGRSPGFAMSDEHRSKIQNSQILNALIEHVEGKREMGATQVSAALGLLRKVMPDLSSAEIKNETTVRYVARVPDKAQTPVTWQQQHSPDKTLQ